MPLYEYKCGDCGTVSEHLTGVGGDEPDLSCVSCGSHSLNKMISIVSVSRGAAPDTCCGGMGHAHGGGGCGGESCACAQ